MSYIDAKRIGDVVFVTERINGVRKIRTYPAPFYYYIEEDDGPYTSMFGKKLSRINCATHRDFQDQLNYCKLNGITTYESDVRIEYKLLEKEYCDKEIDPPHVLFVDIETETDPLKGFANYENPYGEINAITNHLKWLSLTKTYARIPPTLTMAEAIELTDGIENLWLFEDEKSLLDAFYEDIKDADIITGWNSAFYDLPYIIQRTRIVYGKESIEDIKSITEFEPNDESMIQLMGLSPFDFQLPYLKAVEMYGRLQPTFQLSGRIHIDYQELYEKFSAEELHSYRLDYVLKHELGEGKVAYDGTLDQLWKEDFRKFIEYSIQDVDGLVKLDQKKKFVDLANSMAHQSCVAIKEALGSVAIIEQAILVLLHKNKQIASDKKDAHSGPPVAGAFVYDPIGGMYEWICSFDINSLYPSVIRMLNISPETVLGQFDITETENELIRLVDQGFAENRTEAWRFFTGVLEYHEIADKKSDKLLTLVTEDGERLTQTAAEWHRYLSENDLCVTANGTVFDTVKQGIIPYALTLWYTERKKFQKLKKEFGNKGDKDAEAYWDMRQYVLKIFLNSCYGALLNAYFRFHDPRFGQSTTLSGRVVTKHMIKQANLILDNVYDFGKNTIYGDTDSCYLSLKTIADQLNKDDPDYVKTIVASADQIGEEINASFPSKMAELFFVTEEQGNIIASGREVVARRGIFKDKIKKRYALYVIDLEGKPVNKLKIMGMETQRSDTPKWIQTFLQECVELVVMEGRPWEDLKDKIFEFKQEFFDRDVWSLGRPCRVSNLSIGKKKRADFEAGKIENPRLHFSVIAADNFNKYHAFYNDTLMYPIIDGDKIEVIDLKLDNRTNPLRLESIAIPVGATLFSPWVKNLPVDSKTAYAKLVIKKLDNIFSMMGWDFNISPPSGFVFD